ncbi:BtpA/SgcQ family protein [Salibacterium sp. K-3]
MSDKIFPSKPNYIETIFGTDQAVLGMIHLQPLPGAPHYDGNSLDAVYDFAAKDIEAYHKAEVDGLILENAWDLPFAKPENIGMETVAALSSVGARLRQITDLPIGVNCLANGVVPSLAVARSLDAPFVRSNQWVNAYIANEGFVEGASADALRYRSAIKGENIKVFADVHVKHGSHSIVADRSLEEQTRDAIFFDADVLIATGNRTGDETDTTEIKTIKNNTELPVIIGSGMTKDNVRKILPLCNGCIVGSSLKEEEKWWHPVSVEKASSFMDEVKKVRHGVPSSNEA